MYADFALLGCETPGEDVADGGIEGYSQTRIVSERDETCRGIGIGILMRLDGLTTPACLLADLHAVSRCLEALGGLRLGRKRTVLYSGTEPYERATVPRARERP